MTSRQQSHIYTQNFFLFFFSKKKKTTLDLYLLRHYSFHFSILILFVGVFCSTPSSSSFVHSPYSSFLSPLTYSFDSFVSTFLCVIQVEFGYCLCNQKPKYIARYLYRANNLMAIVIFLFELKTMFFVWFFCCCCCLALNCHCTVIL